MGRQKFNKRDHIAKANILHESRDLTNKGLLTEQQNPSCPSIYYNGQPGTQNYWQANYITQGQLNFCAFFNSIPNSTPGIANGTMTGAQLFTACGCSLTGSTQPTVPFCYVCSGGTVFQQSMAGTPPVWQQGLDIVGYTNLFTNPIAIANGYEMCTTQNPNGQVNSPEMLMYQMGGPSNSQGPEAVYWTSPDMPTLLCNSGNTNTATCMNVKTIECNNPSSMGEWPCATIDGVVPDQSYIGKVIDAGTSDPNGPIYYEITEITPSGSAPYGTQDFPEIQSGCPPSVAGPSCTIAWNTPCAGSLLNTGGQNSWDPWLALRQTGWDSVGCQHLQSVVNWNTDQLNNGVNAAGAPLNNIQISRKGEQIAWAQCQAAECGCPSLNVPPLTGGPTPPPPSAPPSDTDGIEPEKMKKPEKGDKKETKKLNEEFTRMKTLWRYTK